MKRLFLVLCLIALIFTIGCAGRTRLRLQRETIRETQQARREATVERFMEKYPDNWQQKLHEYDAEVENLRLKEEAADGR